VTGLTLNFSGGTHDLAGLSSIVAGAVNVTSGTANLGGTLTAGTTTVSGGILNQTGTYNVAGLTQISGGTANFNQVSAATLPSLTLSSGTLGGTGTVNVSGALSWTGGTMSGSGVTNANGTLAISGSSAKTLSQRTLNNAATGTWSGSGTLTADSGAVFNNQAGATFDLQGDQTLAAGGGSGAFNNPGTLRKTAGSGTGSIAIVFNNLNLVDIDSGALTLTGGGTTSGSFDLTGTTISFSGGTHDLTAASSITNGTVNVTAGTANLAGNYTPSGTTTISGGTANFIKATPVTLPALTLNGGTLTGTGTVNVSGAMSWTAGTLSGTGVTNANGTFTISGVGTKTFSVRTLNNAGAATWSSGSLTADSNATLNNLAGATFDVRTDQGYLYGFGASPVITNAGTFRKTLGSGTTTISAAFQNSGTMELQVGTINFNNSYTQTAGTSRLFGTTMLSTTLDVQGGLLTGAGTITANVVNAGEVSPGSSAGILSINGNYTQGPTGKLTVELGGTTVGSGFDRLNVTGLAVLDGTLQVNIINGFNPGIADNFRVMTFAAQQQDFVTRNGLQLSPSRNLVLLFDPTSLTLDVNGTPTANDNSTSTVEDTAVTVNVVTNDTDPDSNTLTITNLSIPANGSVVNNGNGTITYTPTLDFSGLDSFTYTVSDSNGGTDVATVNVNVTAVNDTPTLDSIPNPAPIGEDSGLQMFTLEGISTGAANETQTITITAVSSNPSIIPNPTITYTSPNSTGTLSYTPIANANGSAVITVTVLDTGGGQNNLSRAFTVSVNPSNDDPVLTSVGNRTINEGSTLAFTVSATDPDLPVDALTYSLVGAPGGASINSSTGAFTWSTVEADGQASYPFTVVVTDSTGAIDQENITITVNEINNTPTLNGVPLSAAVGEGQVLTFDASASDTDTPNQSLQFSLVNAPTGSAIDSNTGVFTWTPSEEQGPEIYTFLVRVGDGATTTDSAITVTVREVNQTPILSNVPASVTVVKGNQLNFTAGATDGDIVYSLGNALTFSLVNAPTGAFIDPDTGEFFWTPAEDLELGTYSFKVRVVDDGVPGLSAIQNVTVTLSAAQMVAGDLVVGGTSAGDAINILVDGDPSKVDVVINGDSQGLFDLAAITGKIVVRGLSGADVITVAPGITKNTELVGGAGDDKLTGGGGHDTLIGGPGKDALAGGLGNDVYRFTNAWGVDKVVENKNAGTDSFDFSGATSNVTFAFGTSLTAKNGLHLATHTGANVESVVGGNGTDTLVLSKPGTITVNALNAGTIGTTFSFAGVENLTGSSGTDKFVLAAGGSVSGKIVGGGGTNMLDYSLRGTPVTVNLGTSTATGVGSFATINSIKGGSASDTIVGPNAANAWAISSNNAGKVGKTAFTSIENLTGGTLADTFNFSKDKGVSGAIDGGLGVNALNFAAYSAGVKANLTLGTGTGATGGISNIANVTGGSGNDLVVGNASNNVLVGGAGRDILIGRAGADSLSGGAGEDLLIGGTTSHDSLPSNLDAIAAEWTRTNLGYQPRIDHLTGPAGDLNGTNFLNATSVQDDIGAADTLLGGSGLDWFLTSVGDIVSDKNSGGVETATSL
jgi:hypothetical protein